MFNKKHGVFDFGFKIHNCFENQNKEKPHKRLQYRPLIFNLQQEVLKFNDIGVSCSSSNTDLKANFSNLKNQSFENVNLSQ